MDDNFLKKPGSRDGKPHKGTRRSKSVDHRAAPDTIVVLRKGETEYHQVIFDRNDHELNKETGLLERVEYSLNKDKRWELVEEWKKNGKVGEHEVIVVEQTLGERSSDQDKHNVREAIARSKKGEIVVEETEKKEIKTRKGPKDKQNVKKEKKTFKSKAAGDEIVIVVNHEPQKKEIRQNKAIQCRGSGGGCDCSYCRGIFETRNKKKNDIMKDAGL